MSRVLRQRQSSAILAGLPCNAASAAASRSGTGAMPPAARRTNWNVPSLITARAQISTSGHSAWVRLIARLYSARSPCSGEGKLDALDHLARLQRVVGAAVGAVAEEVADRKRTSAVGRRFRLVGQQCRGHRRGMRRHAGAEVEGCVIEMIARSRRTIRSAFLQAGDMRISKIPAARTLREIAAEGGEVADLRRRQTLRGCGNARIRRGEARVGGDGGDGGEGADAQTPLSAPMHPDRVGRRLICRSAVRSRRRCAAVSERSVPAARNSAACVAVMADGVMRRPSL